MNSKRGPDTIIHEIQSLLAELTSMVGSTAQQTVPISASPEKKQIFSGPSGGIRLLLKESYFREPKHLSEVCVRLRQEGFNYSKQVVSVALLRLVRDRTMVRIPATGDGMEKWVYAERK